MISFKKKPLGLFEAYGVELEYMIVHRETMNVLPIADQLLAHVAGEGASEWEEETEIVAWSNELAMHVIELKVARPHPSLAGLANEFHRHVRHINALLAPMNAMLLPSGMHPWMNPLTETKLWPHEQNEVYRAFDRIFGCKGHGWSNLQSAHLNLPFAGDEEFTRLHAAIRAVLPLIPSLTASTPFVDGGRSGMFDTRLEVYRKNQPRVKLTIGDVVPEDVGSISEYHSRILEPMYEEMAPHDPDGVLHNEWLNSRGAIARFDRSAIEIRVIDLQESPLADLAFLALISGTVQALAEERFAPLSKLRALDTQRLAELFRRGISEGDEMVIDDPNLLAVVGMEKHPLPARELWTQLATRVLDGDLASREGWDKVYRLYSEQGTLARRMLGQSADGKRLSLASTCRTLSGVLQEGKLFVGNAQ